MSGVERIAGAFGQDGKRAAFMPYLMGGFPDLETSAAIGEAYADGGADLVELGVPFSDPLADGPVIQAAGSRARAAGATLDGVLGVAERLAARMPVVLMCYSNLVYARGTDEFARALADAGGSGLIVPDLPLEESPQVLAACEGAGLALVPLVAPTTPEDRLERIGEQARGFIYTVGVLGTTGEREALDTAGVIGRAKAHTTVPVAVGFGIGTPEQAAAAADAGADGLIVGSRMVRGAAEADDPPAAVRELTAEFVAALAR